MIFILLHLLKFIYFGVHVLSKWVTEQLADWAIDIRSEDLPDNVLDKAGDCILDAIACAVAGEEIKGAQRIRSVALSTFGAGDARIWFSKMRLHRTGAAFANSASASCTASEPFGQLAA